MQQQVKLVKVPAAINEVMDDILCALRRKVVYSRSLRAVRRAFRRPSFALKTSSNQIIWLSGIFPFVIMLGHRAGLLHRYRLACPEESVHPGEHRPGEKLCGGPVSAKIAEYQVVMPGSKFALGRGQGVDFIVFLHWWFLLMRLSPFSFLFWIF